ncbi:DUF393 domain-containing protein [Pantoea ananatis]|uniref:thiol-disulfide oxidoreductase DCC family protein n=1 Tax=Pantoea ananas TaxID=553 RepID=UPI00287C063D|nr:DUF393 domain-containing protein [Pantoea ananatis]MDS7721743.1 DUF393 domain-containing protein [Pantoea ananatis]
MEDKFVLFLIDGECTLCNRLIVWVLNRRKADNIRFFTLQSDSSVQFLESAGIRDEELMNTSYLVTAEGVFKKSEAFFRLTSCLRGIYSLLRLFRFVPVRAADGLYDLIARHRYRLFGREKAVCDYSKRHYSRFLLTEREASLYFDKIRKSYGEDQKE